MTRVTASYANNLPKAVLVLLSCPNASEFGDLKGDVRRRIQEQKRRHPVG